MAVVGIFPIQRPHHLPFLTCQPCLALPLQKQVDNQVLGEQVKRLLSYLRRNMRQQPELQWEVR